MSFLWLRRSAFLALLAGFAFGADPANVSELRRGFERPPDDARMMVRWWWFGPSVTKAELEREMRFMKEGGIGGFEVQPTYALELDNEAKGIRNLPYMSAEFLDALTFTGEKAKELGLRMDLTLGSGWPFGGPHIPVELASPRLRVARAAPEAMPALQPGEKLIAVFLDGKPLLLADGKVSVPAGTSGQAMFFISSQTRQTVKRPAVGAEGWVLNHYDTAALQAHFKAVGEPMLKALSKTPPYAIFSDSLEVYNSDWTGDFLAEFQKRRGYDLAPYLPALAGDIGQKTGAVRHDWGLTLSELCDDRYLQPLNAWAKAHGTKFRSQTYGIPPVTLSSQRFVDLPEGEGTQWKRFSTTRWATSANHIYGRPVTSSETWTWLHSPVFRATPLDMKAEADLHFLQGINQLVAHGWPYTPPSIPDPGWRFYAAAVFNQHNPWWIVMPDIATYLQRVSWLLRQGAPATDVAVYMPTHDAFAGFTLGRDSVNQAMEALIGTNLVPAILDAGYNFDFTDDGAILAKGITHKILIVANVERIPLATYQKISEYAAKGGKVLFTRRLPSLAPGLREEGDAAKIRELSAKFQLTDEARLGDALHAALPADFTVPADVGVVHRKLPYSDIYFLANTTNRAVQGKAAFRVQGLQAAWWDPFTGKTSKAGMDLDLAPYESRVLVFSKEAAPAIPAMSGVAIPPVDVSANWTVKFPDAPDIRMAALKPWTDAEPDNAERKFYSGTATYERSVAAPPAMLRTGQRVFLNFGEGTVVDPASERRAPSGMRAWLESPVREAAQVFVNGKAAGAVWKAPFEVEITGLLKPGENAIRVVVANLALNVLAKDKLPDYKELIAKYGDKFQAQDMVSVRSLPAGMLGPVKLVAK
ncbi:MAG: glycosyl hydrolase [Candidatus Solibacter sp.]|nr:glycosyl hydrolase [Candidatus Solibacter sp.]